MKTYTKSIVVYSFEDAFDGFCVEVHHDEDATRFYLFHNMMPDIKMPMFGINPTKNEDDIRDLIESNIGKYMEIYIENVLNLLKLA